VKFRAFSGTEGKGDYFVGFFFGGTVPTDRVPNGLGHAVLSPTFAVAKGLGPWDMLEQNSTFWLDCPLTGHKQVFLTSGLVLGPFPLELFVRSLQLGAGSAGIYRERWLWLKPA
jgi:hypothetical protein